MQTSPFELFRRLTNGVYVVTASHEGTPGAFTAAWITQVSFEPVLIAISINPQNATWPLIDASGRFVINVLKAGQLDEAHRFGTTSGRDVNKLATSGVETTPTGAIVLSESVAWLECRMDQRVTAGDHVVVIARVTGGEVVEPQARPMLYAETGTMDGAAALFPDAFR